MVFKLVESAQARRRAVDAALLGAPVRAGTRLERPETVSAGAVSAEPRKPGGSQALVRRMCRWPSWGKAGGAAGRVVLKS